MIQIVEPGALDDAELASHIATALSHFEQSARRNLATHGGDLIPTGDLLAHCEGWGIGANEAAGLLTGSSPATVETALMLRPVAHAIEHSGIPAGSLDSVDAVRALGPDARAAVDAWLELHMWRTVTSDDVDRPTLAEAPGTAGGGVARCHRATRGGRARRSRLFAPASRPNTERSSTNCWPKLATATASERTSEACVGIGRADWCGGPCSKPADDCTRPEACTRSRTSSSCSPTNSTVCCEAPTDHRRTCSPSVVPSVIASKPHRPLDCSVSPRRLRRSAHFRRRWLASTAAVMANLAADATPPPTDDELSTVSGIGIGDGTYRGRACVVRDLMLAFDQLEPGDVLVAPFTGPSVNSLLPVIGALVVEEGGAMCHAAIVSTRIRPDGSDWRPQRHHPNSARRPRRSRFQSRNRPRALDQEPPQYITLGTRGRTPDTTPVARHVRGHRQSAFGSGAIDRSGADRDATCVEELWDRARSNEVACADDHDRRLVCVDHFVDSLGPCSISCDDKYIEQLGIHPCERVRVVGEFGERSALPRLAAAMHAPGEWIERSSVQRK